MLARRFLVPGAVALDRLDQRIHRAGAVVHGVQRHGEVDARGVVIGVHREAAFELAQLLARQAAFHGQLQGRADRGDLGMVLDLGGGLVDHFLRLVLGLERHEHAREAGAGLGVLGLGFHQGGEELGGAGMVAGLDGGLGLGQQIGGGHLAAGHLQQVLDELLDLALGQRALEQVRDLALHEADHGGHGLQRQAHLRELRDQLLVLVDVDLHQPHPPAGGAHHLLDRRRQRLAGAAPGRPEIDQHGHFAAGLHHIGHEGALIAILDGVGAAPGGGLAGRVEDHVHVRHSPKQRPKQPNPMPPIDAPGGPVNNGVA